jgi:tetratricopeptide (TPR) repeat protein
MKKIVLLILIACAAAFNVKAGQAGAEPYARDGARFALEGRLSEAARAFEQAVALDPSNGNAFYALGNVYAEMGRWADAINTYYKAVSLNKQDVEALNNLGIALGMRGQHTQAASAFQRAIKVYPKWAEPYYHLGEARRELGQEEEAREAFDRALKLRPDYAARPPRPFAKAAPAPRAGGGSVLNAMRAVNLGDNVPERVAATPETLTTSPRPSPTPSTNDAPAAPVEVTPRANEAPRPAAPEESESPYDLGVREARAGRHREAVAAFRQAVALDRGNASAYRALGDAYSALGDWGESVDAYEQAARLAPGDEETYQKLGRAYAKLRETTPAPSAPSDTNAAAPQPRATAPAAAVASAPTNDPDPTAVYRVGPGDVLDVRLPGGGARRAATYEVTPTGLLDHPALKEPLNVAGLTPEEVGARLGSALGLRARGAASEVAVGVSEYRSHAIIVGGMVKDAGTKILQREGVPLYVIVAYAQPLAEAGQAVVVSHAAGRETAVDLSDSEGMKTLVRQGDVVTLRALPRQFVYVAGAVREPGQREFHAGLTLTQAVLAAGGATTPGGAVVNVTRQAADGRLSTTRYLLAEIRSGKTPDPVLRAGDRVEVLR